MVENRITKIVVYTIVAIMMLLLFAIAVRLFTGVVLIEKLKMDNAFTRTVMFDNETLKKPFGADSNKSMKERISDFSKENLVLYTNFTECAKAYNHALGWTVEKYDEETVLTLDDGTHVGTVWKMNVASYTENIRQFNTFLKENDLPLLYAALPGKISKEDT